jgi:hypothetical protein
MRLSSIGKNTEFIFHLPKYWKLNHLPISKKIAHLPFLQIEVVFHLPKFWGRLLVTKILGSFSIYQYIGSSSSYQNIEVVFHEPIYSGRFPYWGCLLFNKILRSSFIYQKIEVVFPLTKVWGHLPFPKYRGRLPFTKRVSLSSNLGPNALLYGYLVKLCWFPAFSTLLRVGDRPGSRVGGCWI